MTSYRIYRGPDVWWLHGDVLDFALFWFEPRVTTVLDGVTRPIHKVTVPGGRMSLGSSEAVGRQVYALNLSENSMPMWNSDKLFLLSYTQNEHLSVIEIWIVFNLQKNMSLRN